MAVRLTVVIVQAAQRDHRMSDLEEQVLTLVMLENNLDAVFVGALEQMDAEGTDALCLSKIPAGSVVVSWMDLNSANEHVARLGLPWRLAEHAGPATMRFRRLDLASSPQKMVEELQQILKLSNIKTMQISLTPPSIARAAAPSAPPATIPTAHAQVNIQPEKKASFDHQSPRDDLDKLVDDLEAMDL